MSIHVSCEACGKQLKVRDEAVGKRVKCPECGGVIEIPVPDDVVDAEATDENPFAQGKILPEGDDSSDGGKYDRKPCPTCGEMIVKAAAKCRFCGEVFDPTLKRQSQSGRRESSGYDDDDIDMYPTADLGKRFMGFLADGLATLFFVAPGCGLMITGIGSGGNRNGDPSPLIIMGILTIIIGGIALFVTQICLMIYRSQSIGKYFVGTRIMDHQTNMPADFLKSFVLRSLVNGIIGSVVPFYGLVDILFIFGDEHRCLHDQLAGTYVIDIS